MRSKFKFKFGDRVVVRCPLGYGHHGAVVELHRPSKHVPHNGYLVSLDTPIPTYPGDDLTSVVYWEGYLENE